MWYFFFFNDTATTEIYTLSLHDALPIWEVLQEQGDVRQRPGRDDRHRLGTLAQQAGHQGDGVLVRQRQDRKSTRLNSSHANISYAVFCLKKKKLHTSLSHH